MADWVKIAKGAATIASTAIPVAEKVIEIIKDYKDDGKRNHSAENKEKY